MFPGIEHHEHRKSSCVHVLRMSNNLEMAQSLDSAKAEESRIRAAYAKRDEADARYSWFSPGYQFMMQERERRLLALLQRYGYENLKSKTILEVGCGTGEWLRDFVKWGARP